MTTNELFVTTASNTQKAYDRILEMQCSGQFTIAKLRGLETFLRNATAAATVLANRANGEPEPKAGE